MERTERIGINEIASLLSAKNEKITNEEASLFLKEWIAVISDRLAETKQVEVTGFGTFSFSQIRESETAERIEAGNEVVPYFYKIGFTPHETLRNSVNIFFSNFEPSLLNEGVTFDALPEVIAGEEGEEEYISNHMQKMVSMPGRQIGESEILEAELPVAEIPTAETPSAEIPEPEIHTAEETFPEETIQTESAIVPEETVEKESVIDTEESVEQKEVNELDSPLSNILSESLRHLSPEPRVPDRSTQRERVRKRKKTATIWVPILGGMAIIVAALFFFWETHGKSRNDRL
jgi:nucleoid DNA-binding protein